jgi:ATP-dependent RNA helicase DeaD
MTTFADFDLDSRILENLKKIGFETPTPIQAETIAPLMAGHDILGQARTGSGKTAAFGLPLCHLVGGGSKAPKGLVLCPTRELAIQVTKALESFVERTNIRLITIYGGAPYPPQNNALRRGVDIVVGTPGRVIDHMNRGSLKMHDVKMFVLDEADEMLRMGFMEPVEEILAALPEDRQIALFSATMPKQIERVAQKFLNEPVLVKVESNALSTDHIGQRWLRVPSRKKGETLLRLLAGEDRGSTLVFCRTRAGTADTADRLTNHGISADAIHGDLNQSARERVLNRFRAKQLDVLVATDVAARGLDVNHITHVINFDFPENAETYTHRIGRTGRMGAIGNAITFVTPGQTRTLKFLIKDTKAKIVEMRAPSPHEIAKLKRAHFLEVIRKRMDEDELAHARKWLAELLEGSEKTAEDVAAATLQLLSDRSGVQTAPSTDNGGPDERPPQSHEERDQINEVELYIGFGRRAGFQVGDLLGAITGEFGVRGHEIGRIQMQDFNTFVGMRRETAERILSQSDSLTIRGRDARISLSRNNGQSGGRGGDSAMSNRNRGRNDGRGAGRGAGRGDGRNDSRSGDDGGRKWARRVGKKPRWAESKKKENQ